MPATFVSDDLLIQGRSAFEPPLDQESRTDVRISADEHRARSNFDVPETEYYNQTYNSRGHPENLASRSLASRSRRAQNDVLSTIGVCAYVDENGKLVSSNGRNGPMSAAEKEATLANIVENEVGFWIGAAGDIVSLVLTRFIVNLRMRLQVIKLLC